MLQFVKKPGVLAGLIILVFFAVSVIKLRYPGLHYDEALFTNAALRIDHTTFVTAHVWRIPLLAMPYIGALKSYFYVPVFWLFGSGVIVIRLVSILAMCLFLWLVYKLVRSQRDEPTALMALGLLASNASIIIFGRTDFGPVVIEHLLFAASALLFFKFMKTSRLLYLALIAIALGLGLFNKLNFLWYINAFYFSGALVYFSTWRRIKSKFERYKIVLVAVAAYLIYVAYYLVITGYYKLDHDFRLGHLRYDASTAAQTLGGQWFFHELLGSRVSPIYSFALCLLGTALILSAIARIIRHRKLKFDKLFVFCLLVSAALLAQIIVTPDATAGWHYLTLQPFVAIAVAISISVLVKGRSRMINRGAALAVVIVAFCQLALYVTNIGLLETHKNIVWSEAIYELADYTRRTPGRFIVADWGIQTQLLTLDARKYTFIEAFGPIDLNNPEFVAAAKYYYFLPTTSSDGQYIITHPVDQDALPGLRFDVQDQVLKIARDSGKVEKVKEIDDHGQPIFEIYRLTPNKP